MLALLIPLLPFGAFLIQVLFARWIKDQNHRVTIPAMVLSFLLSVVVWLKVLGGGPVRLDLYTLFRSGSFSAEIGLYVDQLSALMLLLVTGVSSLVHVYSARYMQGDPRYARYFALISLFPFSMLMLVMSTHLLMLYFFWELMGLCSYLLISHWAERRAACESATRAFLVNAVADSGMGLGILLTFMTFGTLDIQAVLAAAGTKVGQTVNILAWLGLEWRVEVITLIAILFFLGAAGKSAQVPFHIWLPYAMEAPTPVSALIHAATMVKAGVFLVIRLSPLFVLSTVAMNLVLIIGIMTALMAAAVAITQNDIKKILAYSTMSQLGFMMVACGIGAFLAAAFHLLAHGVLKAFLFLSSGSAIENLKASRLPGPRGTMAAAPVSNTIPLYAVTLVMAWLPLALIVLSTYGSLWQVTWLYGFSPVLWAIAAGAAFFTAVYFFRWIMILFSGGAIPGPALAHGQPVSVRAGSARLNTALLFSVLFLSGLIGVLILLWEGFAGYLSPAVSQPVAAVEASPKMFMILLFLFLGPAAVFGGWYLVHYYRTRPVGLSPRLAGYYQASYTLFYNKCYFDEVYDAFIVRPTLRISDWLWRWVDLKLIERLTVHSAGQTMAFARWLWESVDIRVLDRIVEGTAHLTFRLAGWLWQSVDIRGLERLVVAIGQRNQATGQVLREIEPSMLQPQILVVLFSLVVVMGLLIIFLG